MCTSVLETGRVLLLVIGFNLVIYVVIYSDTYITICSYICFTPYNIYVICSYIYDTYITSYIFVLYM